MHISGGEAEAMGLALPNTIIKAQACTYQTAKLKLNGRITTRRLLGGGPHIRRRSRS